MQLKTTSKQRGNPVENYGQMWRKPVIGKPSILGGINCLVILLLGLALAQCSSLSLEQEKRLGEQQIAELNAELNLVNHPAVVEYVDQLGATLSVAATDNAYEIRFRGINSDALNAFIIDAEWPWVVGVGGKLDEIQQQLLARRGPCLAISIVMLQKPC